VTKEYLLKFLLYFLVLYSYSRTNVLCTLCNSRKFRSGKFHSRKIRDPKIFILSYISLFFNKHLFDDFLIRTVCLRKITFSALISKTASKQTSLKTNFCKIGFPESWKNKKLKIQAAISERRCYVSDMSREYQNLLIPRERKLLLFFLIITTASVKHKKYIFNNS